MTTVWTIKEEELSIVVSGGCLSHYLILRAEGLVAKLHGMSLEWLPRLKRVESEGELCVLLNLCAIEHGGVAAIPL